MLKITLLLNENDKCEARNILIPENRTIREVLVSNHIDYSHSEVIVNALPVYGPALDTRFSTMSGETSHYIIQVNSTAEKLRKERTEPGLINTSNCPRAYVFGSACVVVSALGLDEILVVKNNNPGLLQLKNDQDEPVFAIDVENGFGSIKEYGAVYSQHTTQEGKATITILLDPSEKPYYMIREKLSSPLEKLAVIEQNILVEKYGYDQLLCQNNDLVVAL